MVFSPCVGCFSTRHLQPDGPSEQVRYQLTVAHEAGGTDASAQHPPHDGAPAWRHVEGKGGAARSVDPRWFLIIVGWSLATPTQRPLRPAPSKAGRAAPRR